MQITTELEKSLCELLAAQMTPETNEYIINNHFVCKFLRRDIPRDIMNRAFSPFNDWVKSQSSCKRSIFANVTITDLRDNDFKRSGEIYINLNNDLQPQLSANLVIRKNNSNNVETMFTIVSIERKEI